MNFEQTNQLFGGVDIYVIDQILKNRFQEGQIILDAGCGNGRNLKWFYQNNFKIFGVDQEEERIITAKMFYPKMAENFSVRNLDSLSFDEKYFDHIICSAVLHFADDEKHFHLMFAEMVRVLKNSGILFIRVASDIGLDKKPFVKDAGNQEISQFHITRNIINEILQKYPIELIEPVKTTNVQDIRAMTTLVFQKTGSHLIL